MLFSEEDLKAIDSLKILEGNESKEEDEGNKGTLTEAVQLIVDRLTGSISSLSPATGDP